MAKVIIAFDAADPSRQGSTVDVSDHEAGEMVRTGRARYATNSGNKSARSRKQAKSEPASDPASGEGGE